MWILLACAESERGSAEPALWNIVVDTAVDTPSQDSRTETSDSPPEAALVVEITEGPVERLESIQCAAPDAEDVSWSWEVDGKPFEGPVFSSITTGDTIFAGYLRAGAEWRCTATVGARVGSARTTVQPASLAELDPLLEPTMEVNDGVLTYRGSLVGAETLTARFGFDGWAERNAPSGAVETLDEVANSRWGVELPLHFDGSAWTMPVDVPATARVLHAIFTDGVTTDDNDGHEYPWDFVFPSVGPVLTWNDVAQPSNGIVVTWESARPGYGVVEYGPDETNVAWAVGSVADTLHHVALTDLPAGATFVYRVRDAAGRVSPWYSFTTATEDLDTFTFLVASDMQDSGAANERWPEVAAEMVSAWPDARFVLTPGDLAADNYNADWWRFFDGGRELFARVPIVPAVGNHDTPSIHSDPDTTEYRRWFDLPTALGDEDQYRLDFGTMRIFSLNTEVWSELDEGGAQYDWMEDEVTQLWSGEIRQVDWAITQGHHPVYNVGKRFADEGPLYRTTTQLFDGNIDLDIRAHEHIYQRFDPLSYALRKEDTYGVGEGQGVAYVVTPSAGFHDLQVNVVYDDLPGTDQLPHLAWPVLEDGQEEVAAIHGYLVGTVSPDALELQFIGMGNVDAPSAGESLDTLQLQH